MSFQIRKFLFVIVKATSHLIRESLVNVNSLQIVYTQPPYVLGDSAFDKMWAHSYPLNRLEVHGLHLTNDKILEVGVNRQVDQITLCGNYQSEDFSSNFMIFDFVTSSKALWFLQSP